MMHEGRPLISQHPVDSPRKHRLSLPNFVTALRIVGSPALVLLAYWQSTFWLGLLVAFLVFTEWFDGFLARKLHEATSTGARLDSIADAFFYSSILGAVAFLVPGQIIENSVWIGAAIASYLCSWLYSWIKFRRLPSYHTLLAKGAWLVVGPGIACLVAEWQTWVFQLAMAVVVVANVEAMAITRRLREPRVNVLSIWTLPADSDD